MGVVNLPKRNTNGVPYLQSHSGYMNMVHILFGTLDHARGNVNITGGYHNYNCVVVRIMIHTANSEEQ